MGWKVSAWLFGILQTLAIGLLFLILSDISELKSEMNGISNRVSIIEGMHRMSKGYPMLSQPNTPKTQYDP